MTDENPFNDMPVIFQYTRAQAIEDGVLVDLTEWASETGFVIPVACTAAVWHGCVVPPSGTKERGQSDRGRAHDILWMLFKCIHRIRREAATASGNDLLPFDVVFLMRPDEHRTVQLKSICGPGDDAEPVITIMLPHED